MGRRQGTLKMQHKTTEIANGQTYNGKELSQSNAVYFAL